jgi:hypothetical protein
MDEGRTRISHVRALIAAEPTTVGANDPELHRLCTAAARALPASGAAVTLVADGRVHGLAAASDPLSAALEELQLTVGEGPGIEAHAAGRPVLLADLGDGALARWPGYTPAAHDQGVRAVFAFPLQVGAARLGVLTAHRRQAGSLSGASLRLALTFADVAVQALVDGQAHAPEGHLGDGLDQVLDSQVGLYQAQGMVMVDLGVPIADALVRLRAYAYAAGRPLHAVARDVVEGRLRLNRDGRA